MNVFYWTITDRFCSTGNCSTGDVVWTVSFLYKNIEKKTLML